MNSYILFIYGQFDDIEDIEYYCNEVLQANKEVKSLKFLVENNKNLIVILDSEATHDKLSKSLHEDLVDQNVKFYFMFRRDEIVSANLPQEVRDFIFSDYKAEHFMVVQYSKQSRVESLDLDKVLEKIKRDGIESLTKDEKKFLDNFDY
jgi:hypothetical protein